MPRVAAIFVAAMKSLITFSAVALSWLPALAQDAAPLPRPETEAKIVSFDDSFAELIDLDATLTILGEGYGWSEGPVWDATQSQLLFTDVPGNTIYSWQKGQPVEVWMTPSGFTGHSSAKKKGGANGLAFNADGQLMMCEHGDRRLSVVTEHGGKLTLADKWEGKRFSSPNDLALSEDGTIYFTDPPYGLAGAEKNPDYQAGLNGVYRLEKDGSVTCEVTDLIRPNGICLSLDEKTLYVNQSHGEAPYIFSYPVAADGSLGEGTLFFDASKHNDLGPGGLDGLRVDERGNIWTTGPGGVLVLDPAGKLLGSIQPNSRVANLCWGEDGHTLFLTAHKRLISLPTRVKAGRMGR